LTGLGGFGVISGRALLLEEMELTLLLQFVIYEYPRAVSVLIDLALAFILPAAWSVDQTLRAAGDGTDRAGKFQYAISAGGTSLQK
jgi:hypothetical protein